jgi:hypothetical protein
VLANADVDVDVDADADADADADLEALVILSVVGRGVESLSLFLTGGMGTTVAKELCVVCRFSNFVAA